MIDHGKRECYAIVHLAAGEDGRCQSIALTDQGRSGKQRSGMAILAHAQDDKVHGWKCAISKECLQVLLIGCRGLFRPFLSLDPMNVRLRDRYAGYKQLLGDPEITVTMLRRNASLVRPEQVNKLP